MSKIMINPLQKPIEVLFEQFICEGCKKKSYINTEDKESILLNCPFCKSTITNERIFQIEIKGIGEYR